MKKKVFYIPATLIALLLICKVLSGYEFSPNIIVNDVTLNTQGFGYTSGMHSIAVNGDTVYVVWNDLREDGFYPDVYFAKSTDGGTSFGSSVMVNDTLPSERGTGSPTICVDDEGIIYVTWHDNRIGPTCNDFRIYMSKSTDGGETFLSDTPVWDASTYANFFAGIAVDSQGRVIVSFYDGTNPFFHVYCAVSLDSGLTFEDPVIVDDFDSGNPNAQCIGIGPNDEIYIAWHDNRNGSYDIYFDKSTDGGQSFGTDIRVDDTGISSVTQFTPSLAVAENGDIYIAWRDHRNDTGNDDIDIYACVSTDSGSTFSENVKVNDASSGESVQYRPSVATAGSSLVGVAWYDYRNSGWADYPDIFFSFSNDECVTFSDDIQVNDNTVLSDQMLACLAMSIDGKAYIAWTDDRVDPASDIFFSVGTSDSIATDDSSDSQSPRIVILTQNYPNPFNEKVTISYGLPKPSKVKIEIYNIRGQLIETIVDKHLPSGSYTIEWNAKDMSSGLYFYKLTTKDKTFIKKMILMR